MERLLVFLMGKLARVDLFPQIESGGLFIQGLHTADLSGLEESARSEVVEGLIEFLPSVHDNGSAPGDGLLQTGPFNVHE